MGDASRGQIIDAWAQPVLKDGFLPEVVRLFQQSGSAHLLGQDLSAEQLVHLMDKAGVDRVMLCAWHRPGKWVVSNDAIAAFVRQFPERFVGVAAVNFDKPAEAVSGLGSVLEGMGVQPLQTVSSLLYSAPEYK